MALRSVADNRHLLCLDQREVCVLVVIEICHARYFLSSAAPRLVDLVTSRKFCFVESRTILSVSKLHAAEIFPSLTEGCAGGRRMSFPRVIAMRPVGDLPSPPKGRSTPTN